MRCRVGIVALLMLQWFAWGMQRAEAADLRVFCASALREPVVEIARAYARSTGHRVEFVFASLGAIHKRAAMNERADVVIGSAEGIDALVKLGMAHAQGRVLVARSALAIVMREPGRATPADTMEAVEGMLGAAGSIGLPDVQRGVPGGVQAVELIDGLPSAAALKTKIRWLTSAAEAAKRLAGREIDLALLPMSDVRELAHLKIVGPITQPATQGIAYAAAVPRSATHVEIGHAVIAFLKTQAAAKLLQQAGYLAVD